MALAATTAAADAPEAWQWLFQDMATSTGQAAVDLHDDIMFFLITIIVLVFYLLAQISTKFHCSRQLKPAKLTHHTTLEVIWTIIPTVIVLSIAVPSLTLIYSLDQHNDRPGVTVKVIGRQWYWSYAICMTTCSRQVADLHFYVPA
ncbi:cytochrome c oxidase subunit 2 [Haematococcus lacustris]